jgi:hypothetical protein
MGQISEIELELQGRLKAEVQGFANLARLLASPGGGMVEVPVRVASYPKQPTEAGLKSIAAAGAVLTRYVGSRYGLPRRVGGVMIQDREMSYEVLCVADCLLSEEAARGVYDLLDLAADRLVGFLPAGAVAPVVLSRDAYVQELSGSWAYGLLVSLTAQKEVG